MQIVPILIFIFLFFFHSFSNANITDLNDILRMLDVEKQKIGSDITNDSLTNNHLKVINKELLQKNIKFFHSDHQTSFSVNIIKDSDDILFIPIPGSVLWKLVSTRALNVKRVNDIEISGKSVSDLLSLINGKIKLDIEYIEDGVRKFLVLQKDTQTLENLKFIRIDDTLIIRINSFIGNKTNKMFFNQIISQLSAPVSLIVLDFRYNSGGDVDEALEIAGHFIKDESLAGFLAIDNSGILRLTASPADFNLSHLPLTILMSSQTASAAEIFIRAVLNRNDVKIIGETSYGKCITTVKAIITKKISVVYKNGYILDKNKIGCGINTNSSLLKIHPDKFIPKNNLYNTMAYTKLVFSPSSKKFRLCEKKNFKDASLAITRGEDLLASLINSFNITVNVIPENDHYLVCVNVIEENLNDSVLINEIGDLVETNFFLYELPSN